ncbi:hypothetical protein POPTR_004G230000v4 [Populus trichocarpa]|uniref:Uncharacterized protein n=1 Tax=Populus trichocarpa TaxID=3694 RepID=A0ACC0T6E5_POPTR|nr:disease resistance protein RUN1 [Populus trichocarpa]KAI9397076.1 hypothetical protein POPTR_004G230000v4 [Populus trichocarpa]
MAFTSYTYQVFLSFRGEDTRKNFTDHLYSTLSKAGIVTFRDDNSIQRGENIELEIEKAIQESQMSVVVLSKDYASSTWCLDELVMIMDRKRTAGHIVLPVFYDVDPSQVGEQTGNYAEAFAKHQDHFQDDMERVEKWKATLKEVAYLGGMVLQDRHESQFIGDIVEEVGKRLDSTVLLAPYIAWHRYRLLVKKTKMIVYILYIICISIFVGLFLYKFICTWIFLQSEFDRHLKGDQYDRVIWKIGNGPNRAGTEQDFVRELLRSTGTKKNIDMGIKIMCSLVLAFCLS